MAKYDLGARIYDRPAAYGKIVNMVCRALREKKDYAALRRYAVSNYQNMKRRKMLAQMPEDIVMDLLRSIYLSSVRTLDFKTAVTYQAVYDARRSAYKGLPEKFAHAEFRAGIMKADLFMFRGKLRDAAQLLGALNEKYGHSKDPFFYFFLQINLLALHFKSDDFKRCVRIYARFIQNYNKTTLKEEGLGLEMLLFTQIYGALFYYENHDEEHAIYMLDKVKRKYARLGRTRPLKREIEFIRIAKKLMRDPAIARSAKFHAEVEAFMKLKKYIPGDKEYISLNAWLWSKCTGKSYYTCFLGLMG
jgi:hypothetical protein